MQKARRISITIAGCLLAAAAWPGTARAELKVCNKTVDTVYFAVGYKQGDDWFSEGWWTVKSGQCKVPIGKDLKKRYYYVYASSIDDKHVVDGNYRFCAANKAFTIKGDSNCLLRGFKSLGFRKVDVGQSYSYTHMIVSG